MIKEMTEGSGGLSHSFAVNGRTQTITGHGRTRTRDNSYKARLRNRQDEGVEESTALGRVSQASNTGSLLTGTADLLNTGSNALKQGSLYGRIFGELGETRLDSLARGISKTSLALGMVGAGTSLYKSGLSNRGIAQFAVATAWLPKSCRKYEPC